MDKVFSVKRFWLLLRCDVVADKGLAVRLFLFFTFFLFLYYFPVLGMDDAKAEFPGVPDGVLDHAMGKVSGVWAVGCLAMLAAFCVLGQTQSCAGLRDKLRAQAFLSLPASPLEKFLVRCAGASVGLPAIMCCGVLASDALRYVVGLATGQGVFATLSGEMAAAVGHAVAWLWAEGGGSSAFLAVFALMAAVALMFYHAAFLLGGMAFRRWALVLTVGVWLAFEFVCGRVFGKPFALALITAGRHSDALGVAGLVALAAIDAALYLLAYRVFCRRVLVGSKCLAWR